MSTLERAQKSVSAIANESQFYPIFINWQSSLLSSYGNHLAFIRQGHDYGWKLWSLALTPVYGATDLARAFYRAPAVDVFMLRSDIQSTHIGKTAQNVAQAKTSTNPIEIRKGEEGRSRTEIAKYFAGYVLTLPFKLLEAPLIDGLGSSAWRSMERASTTIFRNDERGDANTNGGLDIFVRRLLDYIEQNGGASKFEVVLVGHSMGTIVLNEILRTYPQLPVSNIVYMAAACSVRDYEESALAFMQRPEHQKTEIYHLVLNYAAEVRDRETVKVLGTLDLPPRGSLLVWIDNYFSEPREYRDLTAGRIVNLAASLDDLDRFDSQLLARIHIREFSVGGRFWRTDPQHHGDLGKVTFWRDECWRPYPSVPAEACYPSTPYKK